MLGRNRAAKGLHRVKHQVVNLFFMVLQKQRRIHGLRGLHVVMQVAVAQVAEIDQAHTRHGLLQQAIRGRHKVWNA